nr:MAG: hypothetical protein [Chemarfal virus 134]
MKYNTSNFNFKHIPEVRAEVIVSFLMKKYKLTTPVKFIELCNDADFYCFDLTRQTLVRCKPDHGMKWKLNKGYEFKYVTFKETKLMIKTPQWKTESLFGDFGSFLKTITRSVTQTTELVKKLYKGIQSEEFSPWLVDLLAVVTDLVDPWAYGPKRLFLTLCRLYSIVKRFYLFRDSRFASQVEYAEVFRAESMMFGSLSEVIVGLSMMQMPNHIINMIKTFNFMTGKRIQDSKIFMESMITLVRVFLRDY